MTWAVWSLLVLAVAAPLGAQMHQGEEEAVRRAALDYLEGFYEGDADKIRRGVHPDVVKYGFFPSGEGGAYSGEYMTFAQMIEYADGVKASGESTPASAPKEVELLDVLDQTAAVKVTAFWGSDYLQLGKVDGSWKIMHVLWQTPPRH